MTGDEEARNHVILEVEPDMGTDQGGPSSVSKVLFFYLHIFKIALFMFMEGFYV